MCRVSLPSISIGSVGRGTRPARPEMEMGPETETGPDAEMGPEMEKGPETEIRKWGQRQKWGQRPEIGMGPEMEMRPGTEIAHRHPRVVVRRMVDDTLHGELARLAVGFTFEHAPHRGVPALAQLLPHHQKSAAVPVRGLRPRAMGASVKLRRRRSGPSGLARAARLRQASGGRKGRRQARLCRGNSKPSWRRRAVRRDRRLYPLGSRKTRRRWR